MDTRREARILVSTHLIRELFRLPPDTDIRFVRQIGAREVEITVEHPGLRPVPMVEGAEAPVVTPRFHIRNGLEFQDWGQD